MLAFFRINDPYRLVGIFVLLIIIRIPVFLSGTPLTLPELNWMLLGESVANGQVIYKSIWDQTAPLSALIFGVIDLVFGRSQLAHQIIATLLVFIQSIILNQLLLRNKAYNENSYVPALIYILLMSSLYFYYTLSPTLMSLTFILLAINNLFYDIAYKAGQERFLNTGIYLGLATLFFFPAILFFPVMFLSFIMYTGSDFRKYLLLLFGFIFPFILVAGAFFWQYALQEYYQQYLLSVLTINSQVLIDRLPILIILAIPLIFLVLALLKLWQAKRYNNYQVNFQIVFFFMSLASILVWLISYYKAPFQFVLIMPFLAFFISHYFLLIRRRGWAELLFLVFASSILVLNYGSRFQFIVPQNWIPTEKLSVQDTQWTQLVKGKKILVIGNQLSVYNQASLATPYLNWEMSKKHFEQSNYYDHLTDIYLNLSKDMPEVIIDLEGMVPQLFERMPTIAARYKKSNVEGAYELQPPSN
ncbi:MAG: hypothetical protein ACR2MX_10575 [Cyclobacteriaceae bacterium]